MSSPVWAPALDSSCCSSSPSLFLTPPCFRRQLAGSHCSVSRAQKGFAGAARRLRITRAAATQGSVSLRAAASACAPGSFGGDFWGLSKKFERFNVIAVAPSKLEAAGVTESGDFSQSDEELSSRGLTVHATIDDLDLDQLNNLFAKVSFPRREKSKLLMALQNTQSLLWIQEPKSKQLIAFARATGDRVFHAIIWDVVVDPSYQGLGLGKVLMERLMADLVRMGISNIALYAEPNVVGFYQPLGFVSDPDGIRAMAFSRRTR